MIANPNGIMSAVSALPDLRSKSSKDDEVAEEETWEDRDVEAILDKRQGGLLVVRLEEALSAGEGSTQPNKDEDQEQVSAILRQGPVALPVSGDTATTVSQLLLSIACVLAAKSSTTGIVAEATAEDDNEPVQLTPSLEALLEKHKDEWNLVKVHSVWAVESRNKEDFKKGELGTENCVYFYTSNLAETSN
jgi:hypothetical protein